MRAAHKNLGSACLTATKSSRNADVGLFGQSLSSWSLKDIIVSYVSPVDRFFLLPVKDDNCEDNED